MLAFFFLGFGSYGQGQEEKGQTKAERDYEYLDKKVAELMVAPWILKQKTHRGCLEEFEEDEEVRKSRETREAREASNTDLESKLVSGLKLLSSPNDKMLTISLFEREARGEDFSLVCQDPFSILETKKYGRNHSGDLMLLIENELSTFKRKLVNRVLEIVMSDKNEEDIPPNYRDSYINYLASFIRDEGLLCQSEGPRGEEASDELSLLESVKTNFFYYRTLKEMTPKLIKKLITLVREDFISEGRTIDDSIKLLKEMKVIRDQKEFIQEKTMELIKRIEGQNERYLTPKGEQQEDNKVKTKQGKKNSEDQIILNLPETALYNIISEDQEITNIYSRDHNPRKWSYLKERFESEAYMLDVTDEEYGMTYPKYRPVFAATRPKGFLFSPNKYGDNVVILKREKELFKRMTFTLGNQIRRFRARKGIGNKTEGDKKESEKTILLDEVYFDDYYIASKYLDDLKIMMSKKDSASKELDRQLGEGASLSEIKLRPGNFEGANIPIEAQIWGEGVSLQNINHIFLSPPFRKKLSCGTMEKIFEKKIFVNSMGTSYEINENKKGPVLHNKLYEEDIQSCFDFDENKKCIEKKYSPEGFLPLSAEVKNVKKCLVIYQDLVKNNDDSLRNTFFDEIKKEMSFKELIGGHLKNSGSSNDHHRLIKDFLNHNIKEGSRLDYFIKDINYNDLLYLTFQFDALKSFEILSKDENINLSLYRPKKNNQYGDNILALAIRRDKDDFVDVILKSSKFDFSKETTNKNNMNALALAYSKKKFTLFKRLVGEGASPNIKPHFKKNMKSKKTFFGYLIDKGWSDYAEALLDGVKDIVSFLQNEFSYDNPLEHAFKNGQLRVFQKILSKMVESPFGLAQNTVDKVEKVDEVIRTILESKKITRDKMSFLVALFDSPYSKLDIRTLFEKLKTPEKIKTFLSFFVRKKVPLKKVINNTDFALAKMLVEFNKRFKKPFLGLLFESNSSEDMVLAKKILAYKDELKIDIDEKDGFGNNLLSNALLRGSREQFELLLKYGASLKGMMTPPRGEDPLRIWEFLLFSKQKKDFFDIILSRLSTNKELVNGLVPKGQTKYKWPEFLVVNEENTLLKLLLAHKDFDFSVLIESFSSAPLKKKFVQALIRLGLDDMGEIKGILGQDRKKKANKFLINKKMIKKNLKKIKKYYDDHSGSTLKSNRDIKKMLDNHIF